MALGAGAIEASAADPCAERLCRAGDNALYGLGDTLQDTGEALRCYKRAAQHGSLVAYARIGRIYVSLYESAPSKAGRRRALNVLKEGVRRGNYYCYCEMSRLFAIERHLANFAKSWDLFFARRADSHCAEIETGTENFAMACGRYIAMALDLGRTPGHLGELTTHSDAILATLLAELDQVKDHPPSRQRVATVMRWAYEELLPAQVAPQPKRRRLGPLWPAERNTAAA
jgi:TPR repeat protein